MACIWMWNVKSPAMRAKIPWDANDVDGVRTYDRFTCMYCRRRNYDDLHLYFTDDSGDIRATRDDKPFANLLKLL